MSKSKLIYRNNEENIIGEKNILSKIYHPFIVNMYFSFQDCDNLYLIMDLLSGGDLRYHIIQKKSFPFNEKQAKFIFSNILISLEYIHNQKIIHRDLKPENILLDTKGYIRLTDFGIAIIHHNENSLLKETSGTLGYMAPEVVLKQGHSYPSDFFALGIIGYEMMIGKRPYYCKNRQELKDLILSYQPKVLLNRIKKGWSENSRDFINRLLQRRPVKRLGYYGITEIKNHPWLKDVNWDLIKNKKMKAPYIPKGRKEYFDKRYCQEESLEEKYKSFNIKKYEHIFDNFTYININYISNINNKKSNEIELLQSNFDKISFFENKKILTSKNSNKNIIDLNKNISNSTKSLNENKININYKEDNYLSSSLHSKKLLNSTSQLIPNNIIKKNKKNKDFKKENFTPEKKYLNLNDIHNSILKSVINSPIFQKVISENTTNKSVRSQKSHLKSKKKKIINFKKYKSCNEKRKELFNYTSKEKTISNNKYKNLKIINKNLNNKKGNYLEIKSVKNSENDYKNNNINRKELKEYVILNQYFIYNKNISFIINQRNKILKNEKPNLKEKIILNPQNKINKENSQKNTENTKEKNDKEYQLTIKIQNKKNEINNNTNKTKKNNLNKKEINLNSLSQQNITKSSRNLSTLNKKKIIYNHKSNKLYNSQGFNEFRKNIKKIRENKKIHKSLSCKKLIKKDIKENYLNNEKKHFRPLKFDDYFKNTRLNKNNYKNIDNFLSI